MTENHSFVQLLLVIAAVLITTRGLAVLAVAVGQPAILGELVAGVLLGGSVLGILDPNALAIKTLAELGLLILLFEIGAKKLLFPGDAQIENWKYALSQPAVVAKLHDVDLYKVGHHGSRNATPRSMWALFDKKNTKATAPGRLKTMMSTLPGKHGSEAAHTEVPRKSLLAELQKESELHSTDALAAGKLYDEVTLDL